jgi:hypothetical protein
MFRNLETNPLSPNNEFHSYLVTPNGISNPMVQNIGSLNSTNLAHIAFNSTGSKMAFINYKGLMELYDFDRCSGMISNPETVYAENLQFPWPQRWSACFSPSGNILYVTHVAAFAPDSCYLVQYDLTSANIAASADTLWKTPFMLNMGQLKLAPDNKMYLSNNYNGGYPYNDTTYNMFNMNLSVIHYPDSLGQACNLQPYSFYLGGARTYFGLPNNPDYDMPALAGSPCDTLTGIDESVTLNQPELFVTYVPQWQKLFVNAQKLKGKKYLLNIIDLSGKIIYREPGNLSSPYFTKDIYLPDLSSGMYVVSLQTEQETLPAKFIKR